MKNDIIAELAELYFEKTGTSPDMSFYCWLDATGIDANQDAWMDVLSHPEKYFDEVKNEDRI